MKETDLVEKLIVSSGVEVRAEFRFTVVPNQFTLLFKYICVPNFDYKGHSRATINEFQV